MPIIIYGTRGVTSNLEEGDFHCPHCQNESSYKLKQVRRFFTLFFIPIFPISSGIRYVECGNCGSQYEEAVLDYRPKSTEEALTVLAASGQLQDGASLETVRDKLVQEGHDYGQTEAMLLELCEGRAWLCDCGLRYHPSVKRCASAARSGDDAGVRAAADFVPLRRAHLRRLLLGRTSPLPFTVRPTAPPDALVRPAVHGSLPSRPARSVSP